jgi:hypothetical protein
MSLIRWFPSRAWLLAPVCAFAFIAWADHVRIQRVDFVSKMAASGARTDPGSPSGYAEGKRWLIVPEHDNPTFQWIEETQLMVARGDWRVRSVDYENAPLGRAVYSASPYRWWLVLVAWVDHAATGQPLGLCVERAALYADPVLHLLLLVATTFFIARRFGALSAALFSLGLAAIFPLASAFLPGIANGFGLEQVCVLWSVLLPVAGAQAGNNGSRWYILAGIAGGCGLWMGALEEAPIILGIAAGGILAAYVGRKGSGTASDAGAGVPHWRAWALAGATTSLLAYLVEYYPGHMETQLRANYPLYGVAWLGLGELLFRFTSWVRGERPLGGPLGVGMWLISAAAVASLPVAILRIGSREFLTDDLLSTRLTNLPDGVVASGLAAWMIRDGSGGALAAACLPLLLVVPAAWILVRGGTGVANRRAIAIALGPAAAALALAVVRLRWWNSLDAALLVLAVAGAAAVHACAHPRAGRWMWSAALGIALAFGLAQVIPPAGTSGSGVIRLTRAEVEGLYERSLSHWIADHAGPDGATVLVSPFRTSSLCFYGGLRGLGTQNWENGEGMAATLHIVTSVRRDEPLSVVRQRGVTHIVLPSWDTALDDFARLKLEYPESSFIFVLHRADGGGFSWLRPVPYELPPVTGFDERSVLVLQVTDETDPATAQSRFVEYLVETHQMDKAVVAGQALLRYPADLGSLVALAQLAKARGDEEAFGRAFRSIVSSLSGGSDRGLGWDRRVSLAVVLALGGRGDLSRAQVRRCADEATEADIRFLTTESLYHLLVLGGRYGVEIPDPKLHALSLKLIPPELRGRL